MEVAADELPLHRALGLVAPVVAMPGDHAAERRRLRPERRVPGMILEPDEHPAVVGLGEEVADEPDLARARRDVHHAQAGDRLANFGHVLAPEELVAAADREDRRAARGRAPELIPVLAPGGRPHDVLPHFLPAAAEVTAG